MKRKKVLLAGLVLLLTITLVMAAGFAFLVFHAIGLDEPEWNPEIKTDQEVVGIWTDSNHRLELSADHHFSLQDKGTATSGVWTRHDWNLYLKTDERIPNDSAVYFRFVEHFGRIRILTRDEGPDDWDGSYGLSKN